MTRVTLRQPDDLHRRLQDRGRRAGVSLNQVIVSALSASVAREEAVGQAGDRVAAQVGQIRAAMGDAVVSLDADALPERLRPVEDVPGPGTVAARFPRLDPPLPATIIADREDRV